MGDSSNAIVQPPCDGEVNTYARAFDQNRFKNLDDFSLSCLQFGYFMEGQTTVTMGVYIDSTGGAPDAASLRLVKSFDVTTINAVGQMQVQTASADSSINIQFDSATETLVVIMSAPVMSEGYLKGGGQINANVVGTTGETYVGDCAGGYIAYSDFMANNPSYQNTQWYLRLHGNPYVAVASASPTPSPTSEAKKNSGDDDDNSLSTGTIAGISVGVIVGVIVLAAVGYFVFVKKGKSSTSAPLISDSRI
jgi:hypothetical protein